MMAGNITEAHLHEEAVTCCAPDVLVAKQTEPGEKHCEVLFRWRTQDSVVYKMLS